MKNGGLEPAERERSEQGKGLDFQQPPQNLAFDLSLSQDKKKSGLQPNALEIVLTIEIKRHGRRFKLRTGTAGSN